jgi:hypothetical protein
MAAEVLVGAERRVLISGYGALPAPPPPDSLLGRLDQIDLRVFFFFAHAVFDCCRACRACAILTRH